MVSGYLIHMPYHFLVLMLASEAIARPSEAADRVSEAAGRAWEGFYRV